MNSIPFQDGLSGPGPQFLHNPVSPLANSGNGDEIGVPHQGPPPLNGYALGEVRQNPSSDAGQGGEAAAKAGATAAKSDETIPGVDEAAANVDAPVGQPGGADQHAGVGRQPVQGQESTITPEENKLTPKLLVQPVPQHGRKTGP